MISVDATMKWNQKTRIALQKAPEKVVRRIAKETLDRTGSDKVVANSSRQGHSGGATLQSMYTNGVQGDYSSGFYIGNFTDYAQYVYYMKDVHWTNPNTKTKWFEYIWEKYGSGFIDVAIKENKI